MTPFRCLPVPAATAARFRATGKDDSGAPVHRRTADGPGYPCRHCLRLAEPGETMLLGRYDLPRPLGPYWTPSPIFLHERDCPAWDTPNEIAPTILANGLVSVRAYDAEGMCLYDLGHVREGREVEPPLLRALDDPRTAFVNVHTARPGCLLAAVERA